MADPVIHIKDAYFFEIPKVMWPRNFKTKHDVYKVSEVWVELDDQYQDWEFHKQYDKLASLGVVLPPQDHAMRDWHEWREHSHANEGKPFDEFLEAKKAEAEAKFDAWKAKQVADAKTTEDRIDAGKLDYLEYKKSGEHHPGDYDSYVENSLVKESFAKDWSLAERHKVANAAEYIKDTHEAEWSTEKLAGYSRNLAGKILIPQPFGKLRNLHERESGIAISKYMIVEVAVALIIAILFSWLARRVISGGAPKGRMWNFLEVFVDFIRTQIAEPAIGGGHDDHGHDGHAEPEHGPHVDATGHAVANVAHAAAGPDHVDHSHGHHGNDHGHAPKKGHGHTHVSPAAKFTPLLCSIFFFILGCNLAGMLPWIGAPTSAWAVTAAMALVTFATVVLSGMIQFGVLGFFINQVPTMDMPWYMAIVLKPAIFVIEFGGLLIKHAVLSVRLLANMVAGHLVLLAIMALAFGAEAAMSYTQNGTAPVSGTWWIASTAAVLGCTALSMLELFVAFLQAYVFTLLSALFIGASIHKH